MVDLDMESFEALLDEFIVVRGIEKTILQIIFPFLEKIGILWLTNHINPAQEHLVSNIIRQKLIVGIQTVSSHVKINKSVLLFMPEGEYHETSLLFMHYILKSKGVSCIYLGSNVPIRDLEYVVKIKKPHYLYTHLTSCSSKFNLEKFISIVNKMFSGTEVIISGRLTRTYAKKIAPPVYFKRSFDEVMAFVSSL